MKVAIVCDWLTNVGGAEKVLLAVHNLYPEAPIYTSKYDPKGIDWFRDADVRTGWLNIFPTGLRKFLGVFRQRWFSHLDLSEYDLVISVTGAEAKSVHVGENTMHISYCHVPTQYYWQMYDNYIENPGFGILDPVVRLALRLLVGGLRKADYKAAQRVDQFVTISEYAKELIKKYYDREAVVVHPPVEVSDFVKGVVENSVENFYVVTARQVTWKRLDLAIAACKSLKRNLLVIGEGSEHKNLLKQAGGSPLIKFLPLLDKKELVKYLGHAKGYLFPSLEPFGIAPVEALAAGCPVIAFAEGGSRDFIIDGKNGVLFEEQTVKSIENAILRLEEIDFDRKEVSKTAEVFSLGRFDNELEDVVQKAKKHEAE